MAKLVKRCALTKINSVTVETETDPGLGCGTSVSPRTCVRWLENPVSIVRVPQGGKIDKREVQPHTPHSARTRKSRSELTFVRAQRFTNFAIKVIYALRTITGSSGWRKMK